MASFLDNLCLNNCFLQVMDAVRHLTDPEELVPFASQLSRMCAAVRASLETHVRAGGSGQCGMEVRAFVGMQCRTCVLRCRLCGGHWQHSLQEYA